MDIDNMRLNLVSKDGTYIKYIIDPSLELQLESVNQNGYNIQAINNPCYEVQLAAVNKNSSVICHIKDPDYNIQLAAIQNKNNYAKWHFEFIKEYITYQDLLELLELKIINCEA